MNNTYRKFFKVLRAWWVTLMLFAFIPMANAQIITGIATDGDDFPGEEVVVTMNVEGFTTANTYNYYVVYNYEDYGKILPFTHNQTTNIVKTLDGAGDGTIVITATVPVELYTYGSGELTVLVISGNGALEYQLNPPDPFNSDYPGAGYHNLGDESFANYNNEARIFETPIYYGFDAGTSFGFTLRRLNPEPAIQSTIQVKFKKGTGAWTNIARTITLNDAGGPGIWIDFDSGDADWLTAIEGNDISIRVEQVNGATLSSGIDTWAVENFQLWGVLGEPVPTNVYTGVFSNAFYVKNVVTLLDQTTDNFEIYAPGFSIASLSTPAADPLGYFPGEVVTYNIVSGANVSFPAATLFEVYLTEVGGDEREVLLGTFPLVGATGLPAATANRDFTFNTPFLPGTWDLNVRADLRDYAIVESIGSFTIEDVNLIATLDLDATAAASKFLLDGTTYLFPGSIVHVDYELGAGQTINITNLDLQIALDYNDGDGWVELKTQAFSMVPASQTINATLPATITSDDIDLRLRLVYGTKKDVLTVYVERWWDDWGYGGNFDYLPYVFDTTDDPATVLPAGTTVGFHTFAVNNTIQGLVVEYKDDNQPIWTSIGTYSTTATDSKFVSHYAQAAGNLSLVPSGELSVQNPLIRMRWADGGPLGANIALIRGVRFQMPNILNKVSNTLSVGILYPHLTMSDNVVDLYEFADDEASISVKVDYSRWKINSEAQIAVILIEDGKNPLVDPYLYLGSKAAGTCTTDCEDSQTFTIAYSKIEEVFGELPQLPDPAMVFDVWMFLTTKDANDPIMFKTEEIVVGWKDGYDEQPMMITEPIDFTGLNSPLFLSYDWIVTTAPDPMNDLTRPILEYTTGEGGVWTKIDQHDFNTMLPIQTAWISNQTRFRWTQTIELGEWDVQNVKILSGLDNLVTYEYGMTGIPQEIELALAAEDVPPVVDPCEDFKSASFAAYNFTPAETTVNVGEELEITWEFLGVAKSKTIVDQELTANGQFVIGANEMEFTLDFSTDKKVTQFVMTFPTGVTPSAATVINVDGNTLTPTISTTARTVTYASAAGVVSSGPVDFNVTFAVPTSVTDTIDVAFTITDADGTKNGICKIAPALAFPEGTEFYFYIPEPVTKKDDKALNDVSLTAVTADYRPGETQTLEFSLFAKSPDTEWGDYFELTFPAGVTIISAPNITGYGNTLNVNPIVGQTVTWGTGGYLSFGSAGRPFSVYVTVSVDPSYDGNMDIDWYLEGDYWGAAPHEASGTVTLFQYEMPAILINKDGLPFVMGMESFSLVVPESVPTGAYDIYVRAIYNYEDEKGQCRTLLTRKFTDLFVINNQTPEVYQIELTDVDFIDPADDYYWADSVDVKFETFGPWQDFEDLRYEVVLTQYGMPAGYLNEDFNGATFPPTGWSVINNHANSDSNWHLGDDGGNGVAEVLYSDANLMNEWLISPSFDLSDALGNISLNFRFYTSYYWLVSPYDGADIMVKVSTNGGASWTQLWSEEDYGVFSSYVWYNVSLSLNAYIGQSNVKIAFQYLGDDGAQAFIDDIAVVSDLAEPVMIEHYNLGNIPHVNGTYLYEGKFALPAYEDIEGLNFNSDIAGTDFEVQIRAFQGEETEEFIPAILVENINEFFLLGGTSQTNPPLTFDIEDVLRYAITKKLPLADYAGQEVYLQFTYSANITAPNFLTLPRLQVTMDNGLTYTDIGISGSTFEVQKRLDASASGLVYRYKIANAYLTNNTRFRWYQEVPDGFWSIKEISITRLTNEVPLTGYLINAPYHIIVKEPADPADPCDAFDATSLAAYIWAVDSIDSNTGFEAPVIAGQEFEYNFSWSEILGDDLGVDQYPDSTEFLFYAKKKDSNFKKSGEATIDQLMMPSRNRLSGIESSATGISINREESKDVDPETGLWIQRHDGTPYTGVGAGANIFTSAVRWFPSELGDFDGLEITHIELAQRDLVNGAKLKIWQGADYTSIVELYSQDFLQYELSWILVELEEPFVIDASQELWIGIEWDGIANKYPIFRDATTDYDGIGNLSRIGAGNWIPLSTYGITGDWVIGAFVFGAEGPILLNKDGVPAKLGEEPFIGFVPADAVTGVYEVEARATIYGEDGEKWACGPYSRVIKSDLLIINEDLNPEDVLGIELHGVYTPDTLLFVDELVVGQEFNALYSTYGAEWPEGMNFAAVLYDAFRSDVLGVVDLTGEDVEMEGLRMPYRPFENPLKATDYDLELRIVAYEGDELVYGGNNIVFTLEEKNGFVTDDIETNVSGSVYGYNFNDDEFNLEGNRWVTTPVMDLSAIDNTKAKIWFTYYNINVSPTTFTIPLFQVSVNGGQTWVTLKMLLHGIGNKLYNVAIDEYFSATTQFRWIQQSNLGEDKDVWNIDGVMITTGTTNIFTMSNAIEIDQILPQVDVDYEFALELGAFDLEPTIYAGDQFDFTYDLVDDGYMFPEGTEFTIYLYQGGDVVIDDLTGEEVILYQGTDVGSITATAPITERGAYDVFVVATFTENGNVYLYDEDYVGSINIYNPVIRTNYVGLDVPYSGGFANFNGVLEIDVNEPLNPNYFYNLIIVDGFDEWLIAVQQGSAVFNNVMLPKFFYGSVGFKIQASTNGPLGVVGSKIDNSFDMMLDAGPVDIADETDPGQREWVAFEMEDYDVDLADYVTMSFDVYFSEELANLTEAQHMILEYSIDGGKSYTAIHTYPDERFADDLYFDGDWFVEEDLPIPDLAKVEGAIIRFRIQETKGDVSLRNVKISADKTIQRAPYFALVSEYPVARQRVEILGFDNLSYCSTSEIEMDFNIRGSFGQFVVLSLYADGEDTGIKVTGVTDGSGQVIIPGKVLTDINVSGDITFQFWVEDYTFDVAEYGYYENDFWGDESDFIEVIAQIDEGTNVEALNDYSCVQSERFVVVEDPQDFFVYQARNAVTLENLSEAIVYDPEDLSLFNLNGDFVLPIGVVSERIIVEVIVTAQSKDGSLVCETLVLNDQIVFDVRNLAIQYLWDNNHIGGVWMDVPEDAGDMIICYGSNDLFLRIWDYSMDNGNGGVVNADIKWYRDDELIAPVGATGMINTFPLSDDYYAVVTSELCDVWTSQAVSVVVEDAPVKPIIEFIGSQELCEGEHATLQIAADYEFYRWYRNGWLIEGSNTNWIDIYQSGYYEVEVSNYPFDPFVPVCTQFAEGLSVNLNIHYKPYIPDFYIVDNTLCEPMPAQIVVSSWEDNVWYQAYILETGEPTGAAKLGYQGNLVLETDVLDHEVFLGVMAWRMGVETCDPVYSTQVYEVAVYNLTIEVSGNVLIATLAPYDNRVVSYQWYKDNVAIQNNGTGRTLTVYDEASYSVKVRTSDGCILTATLAKADEDTTPDVVPSSMTVSLYPNPVQDNLTLKLDGNYLGNIQVRIINLAGVVIYDLNAEKAAVEFEQVISVDNLTQGVYIIQITGGEYSEVKRFIKK